MSLAEHEPEHSAWIGIVVTILALAGVFELTERHPDRNAMLPGK